MTNIHQFFKNSSNKKVGDRFAPTFSILYEFGVGTF